jgi:hypothetical protein
VDVPFEADGPAQYTGHKQPYQEVAADGFWKKSKILKHIPKRIVDFPRKKKTPTAGGGLIARSSQVPVRAPRRSKFLLVSRLKKNTIPVLFY